ncbi:MAG: hypothetical protein IJO86_05360 [Oscillospiraceae bacterium]|nr:hypothetical protein [Oscillospiraceae bacterium]
MKVCELKEKFGFAELNIEDGQREINGVYCGDLLSWVMGRAKESNAWITIMSNVNVLAVASLSDVACVILSEGVLLDDEVLKTAQSKGINVLSSPYPTYETAVMLSKA